MNEEAPASCETLDGFIIHHSLQHILAHFVDIARAQRDQNVARLHFSQQGFRSFCQRRQIARVGVSHLPHNIVGVHRRIKRLARAKNVGDQNVIGVGKAGRKIGQQRPRAAERVRLEHRPNLPADVAPPRRCERGSNFSRMVRVIVYYRNTFSFALDFKPPPHPAELR